MVSSSRRLSSAFTLIELLVVITIIAILAAILFPVFAQAREKARQTNCLSNIKNVGTAMLMYQQDADEMIMPNYILHYPVAGTTSTYTLTYWFGQLALPGNTTDMTKGLIFPYTKNVPINECPSAVDIPNTQSIDENGIGYGYNYVIASVILSTSAGTGSVLLSGNVPMADIKQPSDTLSMADSALPSTAVSGGVARYSHVYPPYSYTVSTGVFGTKVNNTGYAHARHNGMCDVLWMDGHVKALPVNLPATSASATASYTNEFQKAHNIGFLTRNGITGDPAADDYYFLFNK